MRRNMITLHLHSKNGVSSLSTTFTKTNKQTRKTVKSPSASTQVTTSHPEYIRHRSESTTQAYNLRSRRSTQFPTTLYPANTHRGAPCQTLTTTHQNMGFRAPERKGSPHNSFIIYQKLPVQNRQATHSTLHSKTVRVSGSTHHYRHHPLWGLQKIAQTTTKARNRIKSQPFVKTRLMQRQRYAESVLPRPYTHSEPRPLHSRAHTTYKLSVT